MVETIDPVVGIVERIEAAVVGRVEPPVRIADDVPTKATHEEALEQAGARPGARLRATTRLIGGWRAVVEGDGVEKVLFGESEPRPWSGGIDNPDLLVVEMGDGHSLRQGDSVPL